MDKQTDKNDSRETASLTPLNHLYHSPSPSAITLMAFSPNIDNQGLTDAFCAELADCGFNSTALSVTMSDITTTLNNCGKYGIYPIIGHSQLALSETACKSFVNSFKNNPYLGGWYLYRNVGYDSLSDSGTLKKYYDLTCDTDSPEPPDKDTAKEVNEFGFPYGPDHLVFVGLYGEPTESLMQGHTYEEYINRFQDLLKPSLFPFTYDVMNVWADGSYHYMYDRFFLDLEIFHLVAKYTGRPFWSAVRCQAYTLPSGSSRPAPTIAQMRFSALSALAYGAQGLMFSQYRQAEDKDGYVYSNAPLDRNGNKTATWELLKKVNSELKALNPVFFQTGVVKIRHTGSIQYPGTAMLKGAIGPIESVLNPTIGEGFVISHLCTKGTDYLVILNKDLFNSQTLKLRFSSYWTIVKKYIVSGKLVNASVSNQQTSFTLEAGGYLILTWS